MSSDTINQSMLNFSNFKSILNLNIRKKDNKKKIGPLLSCRSFLIQNIKQNQIYKNKRVTEQFQPASLTKIVTFILIQEILYKNPNLLTEYIEINDFISCEKIGTNADLRTGEIQSIHQLLYALLLPSGNDAALALSEYFGKKFQYKNNYDSYFSSGPQYDTDQWMERGIFAFIQEMNKLCREKGWIHSSFNNPHGLSNKSSKTTSMDMLDITLQAWNSKLFREIVGTKQVNQNICRRINDNEYQQQYKEFRNTNLLLDNDHYNYLGCKTGWNPNVHGQNVFGNLVSIVKINGIEWLIITIGSKSKQLRFYDTHMITTFIEKQM